MSVGICPDAVVIDFSDDLLETSLYLAHELGHLLGMRHDFIETSPNKTIACNNEACTDVGGIMDWYGSHSGEKFWSTCSVSYLTDYYNKVQR